MLKAGLLPSPIIIPLSSNSLAAKNKIHTQTFIELRSDIPDVRIFFTVDGSKPDLSQISRTGNSSPTHFYRGAFRLEPGKRIVKAIAVTSDGLRESHITTKYFDVNDMYEAYSDNEQYIPENNDDQSKPHFDRSTWNENFNTHRSTSPVQGNFSSPIKDNRYEHMREQRIPPPPPPVEPVRYLEVTTHEEENFWDRKSTPLSSGNGNWKKTLEHLFINIYNYVKNEQQLREIFGWKKFGRMETTRVIDKGGTYHVVSIFKKPLGEQSSYEQPPTPVRKHRRKKHRRTPPPPSHDIEDEKSSRRTHSPVHREQSIHDENEDKRAPRIYTEEIEEQGTLIPYPDFNADADTEALHKSVNDENIIIEILGNRTCDQRMKIRERYRTKYNRDFDADLNTHDTNESFRNIIKQLFYSPVEYDCYELQRGIKGLDANQEVLIEILATRSNKRIQAINNLYPKLFDQTLENEIVNNTNGYFKKLLIALLNNQRPETNQINENNIRNDAKSLYEAGDNKWTDEPSKFIQIVCNRSDVQLKAIFETYRQYSKRDLEADIQAETSGDLRKSLLTIVRIMRNRPGYFAYRFKKNLKAANTDENDLNRIVISRCEIDMVQIKNEYEHTMQHSLDEDIKHNKNEDYQHILLELIKDPNQRTRTERPKKQKSKSGDEPTYEQPEIYHEEIIQQGTMIPARNFDPNGDAEALRKAMKGVGTDEKVLISILGNRTTSQRLEIKSAFKKKFNRDLLADLKSETSGNFCKLLERLMMDPIELDCFELKEAVKGVGTDEEALIEILASRSNERIKSINETYRKMYSKSLEKDVKSDTSGDFRRLLVSLLQGQRPETTEVNMGEVKHDAQALVEAGKGKFQTDNAKFNSLYCERSDPQLKAIFNEFSKINGKSIEDVIKKETSGDHQKALLATIKCIQSRPDFFAERLKKSIEGVGTKESILNRILITRSEIDLVQIKLSYKNLFKRELEKDVSGDTSGDYKKLLLEILKDPSQRN